MHQSIQEEIQRGKRALETYRPLLEDVITKDLDRAKLIARFLENQEQFGDPRKNHELRSDLRQEGRAVETPDQITTTPPLSVFPALYAFPTITQIFQDLVAMNLVTTTTMDRPVASVLYKNYLRSTGPASLTHMGSYGALAEGVTPDLVRMRLEAVTMQAEKYSLRTEFSQELLEDAMRYGINVQAEAVDAMAEEIAGELDWLIIQDLYNGAGAGNVNWDSNGFVAASYYDINSYEKTLWNAVVDARNLIFKKVYRNPDFIVGGVDACARLEKIERFYHLNGPTTGTVTTAGTAQIGTLAGQFTVYKSVAMPANKFLLGVSKMPYIWATYIPLELTPLQWYNTQSWDLGIRTRFARKMVRADALSTITIT